jgi:uncharacterized protein (TIGR00255 family)
VLLSMTGFGEGRRQNERIAITVEIKSVNNKHLKVSIRSPDSYLTLEHDLEKLVRQHIGRGTVYLNLYADRLDRGHDQSLDADVLRHYWQQVQETASALGASPPNDLSALLPLPGVVVEARHHIVEDEDWPLIEGAVTDALTAIRNFRIHEGESMALELAGLCDGIDRDVAAITDRAPGVVADYRTRILARVQDLLGRGEARIQDSDVLREVSLFADRCDITEEITRLRCHIGQFRSQLAADQSPGRKLDFLCQEMFREVNTIGSKANDVSIAHLVVDAKTRVEKMREIVQNVE